MTTFKSLTPNLVVRDIAASARFYTDIVGCAIKETVPGEAPFVFVWLERDGVPIFLNDAKTVESEVPEAARTLGGAGLFIIVDDVDALHESVMAKKPPLVMPLKTQFYGMREFAITDPDGNVITFAERVEPR